MKFQNVKFLKTVVNFKEAPYLGQLPEMAVLGRSNVGKSTLLNHLFSKNLVKTSSTPGKTRALNFFSVDEKFICVDMPGFGFAAVSEHEKKNWAQLIESYLNQRESLKLLLYLFDIRRTPNALDEQMVKWIEESGIPAILILTKADKLTLGQRMTQTKKITSRLILPQSSEKQANKKIPFLHYSATKNVGRKELIAMIRDMLDDGNIPTLNKNWDFDCAQAPDLNQHK